MSTRLDEQLRDGLRDLAERVQPTSSETALNMVYGRATDPERGRDRRHALAAFVLLLVGALAFGVAAKVLDAGPSQVDRESRSSVPTAPECRRGTHLPCDPGDGNLQLSEKLVVAEGEHNGSHWQLLAYRSEDGVCLDFRVNSGSGGSCGAGVPPGLISLGESDVVGFGRSVDGFVRKDVARVRLELSDGSAIEVAPVGENAGFEANFFVAVLPDEVSVTRGIAYGRDGVELGQQAPGSVARPPLFETRAPEDSTTTTSPPPPLSPALPRCAGGGGTSLSVTLTSSGDDVAGTATIKNTNANPLPACTVAGAPAVFLQPASGAPLVQPKQLPIPGGETITLSPGDSASATFVWSNWCSSDRPISRVTLRLYPDGGNGSFLAAPVADIVPTCVSSSEPSTVAVEPFVVGR